MKKRRGQKQVPVKQFYLDRRDKDLTTQEIADRITARFLVFEQFSRQIMKMSDDIEKAPSMEKYNEMDRQLREFYFKYVTWENGIQYNLAEKDLKN